MTKTTQPPTEKVNHPSHYMTGGLEAIEVLKLKLTPEEYKGYLKGNCLKYILRADYKDGRTDIEKMLWYGERLKDCYVVEESVPNGTFVAVGNDEAGNPLYNYDGLPLYDTSGEPINYPA